MNSNQSPYSSPSQKPNYSHEFYRSSTIRYIWPNSIPESWNKIIKKNQISILQIEKSDRKTLEFLKETQQYIKHITKPIDINAELKSLNVLNSSPKSRHKFSHSPDLLIGSLSMERFRNYEGSPLPLIKKYQTSQKGIIKFKRQGRLRKNNKQPMPKIVETRDIKIKVNGLKNKNKQIFGN